MKCVKCGAELLPEDRYCFKCGVKVTVDKAEEKPAASKPAASKPASEAVSEADRKAAFELGQQDRVTKLVRDFKTKRDMDSFEMLYQMEASDVFARARMILNSDADAKEVMQRVFCEVFAKIGQLKDVEGFESWLMAMTRRIAFDRLGAIDRSGEVLLQNEAICDAKELEDSFVVFWPEKVMDQKEVARKLYMIMDVLPMSQRICLQMREYDGLSYQDIATETRIPIVQVKNNVFGAKNIVKAKMLSEKIDTANPLGYFYWMLRQGSKVYGCEPPVAVAVWEYLIRNINSTKPAEKAEVPADRRMTSGGTGAGAAVGSKIPIIIAAVVAAVLILAIGGVFAVRALIASSPDSDQKVSETEVEAEENAEANAEANVVMDREVAPDAASETDEDEQSEESSDPDETDEFEPIDYMDEMTEDQKVKLYSILSAVAEVTVPEKTLWSDGTPTSTSADLEHLSIDPGYDLSDVAYSIATSPGFYNNYKLLDDYEWTTQEQKFRSQALVIPQNDMERILETALDQKVPSSGRLQDTGMLCYDNGNYMGLILDGDWVYGYSGLLKIEQIAEDEVNIYGVSGSGNIHYYYETDYDPYEWTLDPIDEYDDEYTTLVHTYSAKARINDESPCGLTILGIQYDDPKSTKIATDEGFTITKRDMTNPDATQDDDEAYYILPNSSKEKLKEADLKDLTEEQLRIARNEIYARYGRKFKDEELQAYFDRQPWYYGFIDPDSFTEDMLTDLERENAEILKKEEEKRKKGN